MGRHVQFLLAGRRQPSERVFFTSDHRRMADLAHSQHTIYHRNDWTSLYTIPVNFFRAHFQYDRSAGIYRTDLRYQDVLEYLEEIHHKD